MHTHEAEDTALRIVLATGDRCVVCYAPQDTWFPNNQLQEMKKQLPTLQVCAQSSINKLMITCSVLYYV